MVFFFFFFAFLSRLVRVSAASDNKGFNERYPAFVLRLAGLLKRGKKKKLKLRVSPALLVPSSLGTGGRGGVINDHAESSAISIIAPLGLWSRLAAVALLRQGGGGKEVAV